MKRFFKWLLLGSGAVLAAGLAWLFTADLGVLKPQIESFLSAKTGREFAIDGELHIQLGRELQISLAGLRVANPAWAKHPNMVSVGEAAARLELLSLLDSPLVIESVTIDGLEINIEPLPPELAEADPASEPGPGGPVKFARVMRRFSFRQADISDLRIGFLSQAVEEPLVIVIEYLDQVETADHMLRLELAGKVSDTVIRFDGTAGPYGNLLDGKDVTYRGEGAIGNTHFTVDNYIDSFSAPRYPAFEVAMEGPDFSEFARSIGGETTIAGPFRFNASADRDGDSLRTSLSLEVADMFINLQGSSAGIIDFSNVDYTVSARGSNLGQFTRLLHAGSWPEEAFNLQGSLHRSGAQLDFEQIRLEVGETYFDLDGSLTRFPRVDKGRIVLNINGPDIAAFRDLIGFRGAAEGAFSVNLQLESAPDGLQHLDARLQTSLATSDISAILGDGPDYAGSVVELSASGSSAGQIMGGFGVPGFPDDPFKLDAAFEIHAHGFSFDRGILATIEDDRWEIIGFVGREPLARDTDIRIRVSGDRLSEFSQLSGADLPLPEQPYQLEGHLRVTDSGFHFDEIRGRVGPNQLSLDGLLTRDPSLAGTDFSFGLSGPNLQTLVRDTERFRVAPRPFEASGHLHHLGGMVKLEGFRLNANPFEMTADIEAKLPFDGAHARFQVAASGQDLDFLVPEHPELQLKNEAWALRADGRVEAGQWTFDEAELRIADASLVLSGVIDQLPDFSSTDFEFSLQVPTPGSLGIWNGDPLPRRSIDIRSHLSGTARSLKMDHLTARMGATDFAGSLVADYSDTVPNIQFEAQSRVIDFKEWLALTEGEKEPAATPPADGRAIPDFTFPLEQMAGFNIFIGIEAQELRTRRQILRDVSVDARLQDGALIFDQVHGEGLDGYIEGTMTLVPRNARDADFNLDIDVTGLKLDLRKKGSTDPGELPLVTIEVEVAGQGRDLRQVAASLNGHVFANSTPGVIPNSALGMLDKGMIEQVFSAMLPKTEESQTTRLQCFAARLYINDGLVKAKPGAALVTDTVQIISNGSINLHDEKVDLTFQAFPTKAFKANISEVLINPFVKISGTLAQPKLALDAPRALISTGVAVGTGGLSILAKGLWDRLRGSKDPCARFMEEGEKM